MEVRALSLASVKTVGGLIVAVFLGGWAALASVTHAAEQTVDGGLAPVRQQVGALEQRLERHIDDEARHHAAAEAKSEELQADVRALYRAVMTGRPQERLEKPSDGGPP